MARRMEFEEEVEDEATDNTGVHAKKDPPGEKEVGKSQGSDRKKLDRCER